MSFMLNPYISGGGGGGDGYTTITELHFEGSEGGTTYTDDAPSPLTWGGTAQTKTAAVYEGTRGADFTSIREMYQPTFAGTGASGFNFGSDDFTIEISTYFVSIPGAGNYRFMIAKDDVASTRGWNFIANGDSSGHIQFNMFDGATQYTVEWSTAPSSATWYRCKAERVGNDLNLYIDTGGGYSLVDTTDVTGASINSNTTAVIMGVLKNGGGVVSTSRHNGYMDYLLVRRKYP